MSERIECEEVFDEAGGENRGKGPKGGKKKLRTPLVCRTGVKVLVFIAMMFFALLAALSTTGVVVMWENGMYVTPEASYRESTMRRLSGDHAYAIIRLLQKENGEADAVGYIENLNISKVELLYEDEDGVRKKVLSHGGTMPNGGTYTSIWYRYGEGGTDWWYSEQIYDEGTKWEPDQKITVTVTLDSALNEVDSFWLADWVISLCYGMRYWVYAVVLAELLGIVLCFVFLLCAAGHRKGKDGIQPGWGTKFPVDVLSVAVILLAMTSVALACESVIGFTAGGLAAVISGVSAVLLLPVLTGWCMSLAVRMKLGGWWRNSLIWYVIHLSGRVLRLLGKMFRAIPFVWRTAAIFSGISFAELLFVAQGAHVLWFLEKLMLFPIVIWMAVTLRRLQKGGEVLAAGDLSHQVDTAWMYGDFKEHGENLNRIGEGMMVAVEQRLKSERMKAELITNVSHDIKTPLTSIINYADLIGKEACENERITEYAEVLSRQSARLKRLIDDLVEASKAATGNLEVVLGPCEVGVLLEQTVGEYEQRLRERSLEIVLRKPEEEISVMADGRRMWRVLDNLMNNVCKYAQGETRVYLTLERQENRAVITLKNISREPLGLSADEFLERFVQGDSSRNSDGNGLGLSIAKSLTELQGGMLNLTVDGDLFKIQLCFPICE